MHHFPLELSFWEDLHEELGALNPLCQVINNELAFRIKAAFDSVNEQCDFPRPVFKLKRDTRCCAIDTLGNLNAGSACPIEARDEKFQETRTKCIHE